SSNAQRTTELYRLSLHDALPIWILRKYGCSAEKCPPIWADSANPQDIREINLAWHRLGAPWRCVGVEAPAKARQTAVERINDMRSEEHTSELQSRENLVCRLLLE